MPSAIQKEGFLKGTFGGIDAWRADLLGPGGCVPATALGTGCVLSVVSRGLQVKYLELRKVWLEGNTQGEVSLLSLLQNGVSQALLEPLTSLFITVFRKS